MLLVDAKGLAGADVIGESSVAALQKHKLLPLPPLSNSIR